MGDSDPGRTETLLDAFVTYLRRARGYSMHTARNYRSDVEQFSQYLKEKADGRTIEEADPLIIRGYLAHRFRQNKKSSLARKISAIRTFYRFLTREGLATHNPAQHVATPKREQTLPHFLSVDEAFRLVAMLSSARIVRSSSVTSMIRGSAMLCHYRARGCLVHRINRLWRVEPRRREWERGIWPRLLRFPPPRRMPPRACPRMWRRRRRCSAR